MENKKDKQNSLIDFNVFAAMNTENCLLHVSSVSVTYVVFHHNTQPLSSREAQRRPLQQNSDEPNKAEQSMLPVQEGWIPCYKVWIRIHFLCSVACFWTLGRPFHWLGRVVDRWELLSTVLHFRSHLRTSPIDRWDVGGRLDFPWLPPVLKQASAPCERAQPADWQRWIRDRVSSLSASTARSDKHWQYDPETRDATASDRVQT